jgi:hypothetical protein
MPGVIIFDPNDQNIGLSVGDDQANSVFLDIEEGKLYIADLSNIYEWEGAGSNMTYTWRSGKIRLPRRVNMGAAIVEAESYDSITFKLFTVLAGVDTQITSLTVSDADPFRLPGGHTGNVYYIEITSTDRISRIAVGQSVFDLAEG